MPFMVDTQRRAAYARSIGMDEVDVADDISFKDSLMAAFRQENVLGSYLAREGGLPDSIINNENFNPWDYFTEDEKLDENFVKNAALADTEEEIGAVRRQQTRERRDRQLLSDSGAQGFAAILVSAGVDPINFIPVGGTAYRTYRSGASILHAGIATASVAAGVTAAQEAGLHLTQIERTFGESAVNVSAAAFLGYALGATPPLLRKVLTDNPTIEREVAQSLDPEPVVQRGGDSVGAQAVFEDVQVRGRTARTLAKVLGMDPLSRTVTSENQATRVAAARLAESPYAFEQGIGRAVETSAKMHDGKYFQALTEHLDAYREYRKGGGTLKRRDFNEAVARQVRNPSEATDPHIARSAEAWNARLYEPLKNEMIALKLLPEDVDVKTAKNYLNRVWNKEKVSSDLPRFIQVVSEWLEEVQGAKLAEAEIDTQELAREIAGRIIGAPDGRLPYDYKIGENSAKGRPTGLKSPFKSRTFNIPDERIEEFLDNDIEEIGGRYLRQVAMDVELAREFGDINMTRELKEIQDEWLERMSKADSDKARRAMKRQMDADLKDITAMRDRLRGVYAIPDAQSFFVRAGRVVRDINYLRFMGGVTASSFPDAARIVMAEGLVNTFRFGLKPLATNLKKFKVSANEAKQWGVAVDALMGSRAEIIADVADYARGGNMFERGVRSAAQKFGKVNLMDQWTSGVKQLHAVVMQTRVAGDLLKGKYDKRLGQFGISEADAKNIASQLRKYGRKEDGVFIANTREWDSQELAMMWGGMLRKESDRVIVMPGQEKPLFMSTELGKSIFQFRSFMFSSTQRMLIAGLQGQDANFMAGVVSLASLGMMAYAFKQWDAGREISDDPRTLIVEGIDRSGVLGILMEANNTIEKTSSNNYGLRPLLGIDLPAARFASRSQAEALLGPSFGAFLENTLRVANASSDGEPWDSSDTRALRRLLPYQNLMIFRQGLDQIEETLE